jgi:hypothetical protein
MQYHQNLITYMLRLISTACPASYSFCWDNTQIDVKARHQTEKDNVWQMF